MTVRPAHACEFEALTDIWEASVRASHDFLAEEDLRELRPRILDEWLPAVTVTVFVDADAGLLGFSGVAEDKLEMLFIAPEARGKGVGRALLTHALSVQSVRRVDVNEQNDQALGFYRHAGFEVVGRSPLDGQGKPYPLLHLCLPEYVVRGL
ncbi:acetyltransferase [Pseudomonas sp. ABC1]|uniref:acetyltransferase n=1 Tax=Pseudomonas sp. ABC1 TaxID=2748080 RepID=UPI0015C30F7D|nr:acetyltransferase [Pseudomonas sp. ABC1]QLF93005.1 acetyltransferase [Pseudomonas sp. ABC1]